MLATFDRVVRTASSRLSPLLEARGTGLKLQLAGGRSAEFGRGDPVTIVVNDRRGLAALGTFDAMAVGEAYLAGSIDVIGDISKLLALREGFREGWGPRALGRIVRPLLFGQVAADKAWIAEHYDNDPDFYTLFLDARHRCYSQAVFTSDDEPLEDAMTRKLDYAIEAVGAKEGDRVLDIGGGWGAFTEHGGKKGIRVTSLTISQPSERYIQARIDRDGLPCRVLREHLFEHRPEEPYDAIVNLGVTEHLPDYPRTLQKYRELLRPGGRICLDASACRAKRDVSDFFERHIFPGNGSPLCLHEYLTAVARSPFEVEVVHNDRVNYLRTTRQWALNLDQHRDEVERRWGKTQYRRFQVYLWGCVDGFTRDVIQAYRWVLHLPKHAA